MRNQKKLREQIKIGSRVLVRSKEFDYRYCIKVKIHNDNSVVGPYVCLNLSSLLASIHKHDTLFHWNRYEILDVYEDMSADCK